MVFAMRNLLHKIIAVTVCVFLLTSMTAMGAWATSAPSSSSSSSSVQWPSPSDTENPDPDHAGEMLDDDPNWDMENEGTGVGSEGTSYLPPDNKYNYNEAMSKPGTRIWGYAYDTEFGFVEHQVSVNFDSAAEAIRLTAPDETPLAGKWVGGNGNYYVQWTVDNGYYDAQGKFVVTTPAATFPEEHITGLREDSEGYRYFTHSITAADNLQDNQIYKYTVTVYNEERTKHDDCTFYVGTFGNYAYRTIPANQVPGAITNATGYIYTAADGAGVLDQEFMSPTSAIYKQMMAKAAANSEAGVDKPMNLTTPSQLVINNLPANLSTPAYLFNLDMQLELDTSIPQLAALQEGDAVTIYRYNPLTKEIETIEGVVAIAYDESNPREIIRDANGNPVLCATFRVSGGSGALGTFAIGYDSAGTYTIDAQTGGMGQITPHGEALYTLEAKPQFALYPLDGYEIESITLERGNIIYENPVYVTDTRYWSGNVFTFDPSIMGTSLKAGQTVTLIANFKKAEPQQSDYNVTLQVTGQGPGTASFMSGAALKGINENDPDYTGSTDPAMSSTVVSMGGSSTVKMPSSAGVYVEFNPGTGHRLKSLTVNGAEIAVYGSSYYVPALTSDTTIVVEYQEGMTEPIADSKVTADIVDEPENVDAAFVLDGAGNQLKTYTATIQSGNTYTVTVQPETDFSLRAAYLYINGSSTPIDVTADVNRGTMLDTLQLFNVVSDIRVTFAYKRVATTLFLSVNGTGGTINPFGAQDLEEGDRIRVIVTPDSSSYVPNSALMVDGQPISNMMTMRDGGAYWTFTIKKSDTTDANDGIWTDPDLGTETDKVIYINNRTSTIKVSFDSVAPPTEPYLAITTSVAGIGGGTVTPTQFVSEGDSASVFFFPDVGYKVNKVTVNGEDVTSKLVDDGTRIDFSNIQENLDVIVTFTNGSVPDHYYTDKFTIFPSSSSGGFISPDTNTSVYGGKSQRFKFFPMTGYEISKVFIDGEDASTMADLDRVGTLEDDSFTFVNVSEDHLIHVTFAKSGASTDRDSAYTVIVNAGEHGKTSPQGVVTAAGGASLPITIIPDEGYTYDKINVKTLGAAGEGTNLAGVSNVPYGTFTLFDVQENTQVDVTFRPLNPGELVYPEPLERNMIILTSENESIDSGAALSPDTNGLIFYKQRGKNYASTAGYFTITVQEGRQLDKVKVNGVEFDVEKTGEGVYSLVVPKEQIYQEMLIEVTTVEKTPSTSSVNLKTITVQADGPGRISPSGTAGTIQVESGKGMQFYFIPDDGCHLEAVYVNNVRVTVVDLSYTLSSVTVNTHVRAEFAEGVGLTPDDLGGLIPINVLRDTSNNDPGDSAFHGTVSPEGNPAVEVIRGGSASFALIPDSGYQAKVFMDSMTNDVTNNMSGNTITLSDITMDTTLYVQFVKIGSDNLQYHTVTVTHGDGGWVSPEGTTRVLDGKTLTFTVIPDSGKTIDTVTVNGQPISNPSLTFTLQPITEDTVVDVQFRDGNSLPQTLYDLNAYTYAGGMVSPNYIKAAAGTTARFTFIPLQGYTLREVLIDGGASSGGQTIPASSIPNGYLEVTADGNHTIVGYFDHNSATSGDSTFYTILVGNQEGGQVSPARAVSVPAGGSQTFTILPDSGYKVDRLVISTNDGSGKPDVTVNKFSGNSYTLFNVTSDMTFTAFFTKLSAGETTNPVNTHTITATSSVNGSISPAGVNKVAEGAMAFYSFVPAAGYKLSYFTVDGEYKQLSDLTNNQYVFYNVTSDHTINAVFCHENEDVADFVTITVQNPGGGSINPTGSVLVRKGDNATFAISALYGYSLESVIMNGQSVGKSTGSFANYSFDGVNFTFKNVSADGTLSATFTKGAVEDSPTPEYTTITVIEGASQAGASGSVSYNWGTSVIEKLADDEHLDVSIIPDSGCTIDKLTYTYADGTVVNVNRAGIMEVWQKGYQTFQPSQVNNGGLTIEVTWRKTTAEEDKDIQDGKIIPAKYHEIDSSWKGSGIINAHGKVKIANGSEARFTMIPDTGYELTSFTIDGAESMSQLQGARTYKFNSSDRDDHVIVATFGSVASDTVYYTINVSAVGNGKVSPETVKVAAGESVTLNFFPDDGYKLTSLQIDDQARFSYNTPTYTLTGVSEDHEVVAYFNELGPDDKPWNITPVEIVASIQGGGNGCAVSPENVTVPLGSTQRFTMIAGEGFEIDYVTFNDKIFYVPGNTTTYTVSPIQRADGQPNQFVVHFKIVESNVGDLTVTARVTVDNTVVPSNDSGTGTVTPTNRTVPYNGNATFYIFPDPGSTVASVSVDGRPLAYTGVDGVNIGTMQGRDDLLEKLGATSQASENGSGTEAAAAGLYTGGAQMRAATGNTGNGSSDLPYEIFEGKTLYSAYMTTVPNITTDVTLNVVFRKIVENTFDYEVAEARLLTVTSEGGGTVSPVGQMKLPQGGIENIRFKTYSGYYLDSVMVEYYDIDPDTGEKKVVSTVDMTDKVNAQSLQIVMGEHNINVHAKYSIIGTPSFVNVTLGDAYMFEVDADGNPVFDNNGNPVKKDIPTRVIPSLVNEDGTPKDFVRGQTYQFTFETSEKGPNGRDLAVKKVIYNGQEYYPVWPSTYVDIPLYAGGEIEVIWEEIADDEELIDPPTHTVTAIVVDGTGGMISPSGEYQINTGGSITYGLSAAEDGWLIASLVDKWTDEDGVEHVDAIDPSQYYNGEYVLANITCDHVLEATFVPARRLYVEWDNTQGYVTPNNAPGQYIYLAENASIDFFVAPYLTYEVEGVWVDQEEVDGTWNVQDNMTDTLVQTETAQAQIKNCNTDGSGQNSIKFFEKNQGINGQPASGAVAQSDTSTGTQIGNDTSSDGGLINFLANLFKGEDDRTTLDYLQDKTGSVNATSNTFARAYQFSTPDLIVDGKVSTSGVGRADDGASVNTDVRVRATFVKDPNQSDDGNGDDGNGDGNGGTDNSGRHHVTASVADNIGGTVSPTDTYVDDGGSVTFNFYPDPTYSVAYVIINGNRQQFTGTQLTLPNIREDTHVEVLFGSSDPTNPISRALRTLQALAQTGDLAGPAIVLLLLIAGLSLLLVFLGGRRRKKREDDNTPRGPRPPFTPGGGPGIGVQRPSVAAATNGAAFVPTPRYGMRQ